MVFIEGRLREERALARKAVHERGVRLRRQRFEVEHGGLIAPVEDGEEIGEIVRGFVQGNRDGVRIEHAQVDVARFGQCHDRRSGRGSQIHPHSVEERPAADVPAELAQARCQRDGEEVDAPRDLLEPLRPVVNGIH